MRRLQITHFNSSRWYSVTKTDQAAKIKPESVIVAAEGNGSWQIFGRSQGVRKRFFVALPQCPAGVSAERCLMTALISF